MLVKLMAMPPSKMRLILTLACGVLAVSFAAIFIRLANSTLIASGTVGSSLAIAALRLLIASLLLWPFSLRRLKAGSAGKANAVTPQRAYLYTGIAGLFLAVHFASYISSLNYTSIAASTTLVNTTPIFLALCSWLWQRVRPAPPVIAGMICALLGGLLIALGGSGESAALQFSSPLLGNALALVGAVSFAAYFLVGTRAQHLGVGVMRYVALAYLLAALVLLPLPLLLQTSYLALPAPFYFWILMLALIPQSIGHTSFNWAVKYMSPTLVSLVVLLEPVMASSLGYVIFRENPGRGVFAGAPLILLGVALALWRQHTGVKPANAAP